LEYSGSPVNIWQIGRNGMDGAKTVGDWSRLNTLNGQYILNVLSYLLQA
jgi:hypothetical protein